jgi:mono/diheme cytochrome c family protein
MKHITDNLKWVGIPICKAKKIAIHESTESLKLVYSHTTFITMLLLAILMLIQDPVFAEQKSAKEWRVSPRKAKILNPILAEESSIALGTKLYLQECQECHGETGRGDGPEAADLDKSARDFTNEDMWGQADGAIYWKIRTGRRPMPGFKNLLSADEIWHLTNFMRNRFGPKIKLSAK